MTVQSKARLHEKTVQAVAQKAASGRSVRYTDRPASPRDYLPVRYSQVDRALWSKVKQILADKTNGYSVVEIISNTEVVLR